MSAPRTPAAPVAVAPFINQRLLRPYVVEPVLFHPDGCSGFAPIGSYAINIVRVALTVGLWAMVLLASGPLTGHGLYVAPHILFLIVVQVLLTPYLLMGPVWYAHRVMRQARDRALAGIQAEIRSDLLAQARKSPGSAGRNWDYRELEAELRLTEQGYRVWPFRPSAFSGVSVTAGITLIANVIAILYRTYGRGDPGGDRPWGTRIGNSGAHGPGTKRRSRGRDAGSSRWERPIRAHRKS